MNATNQLEAFKDAIAASGMVPPDAIEPGRFYNFSDDGGRNKKGWCKFFLNPDGSAGGVFGSFRGNTQAWHSGNGDTPPEIREQLNKEIAEAKKQAETERKTEQEKAAQKAAFIYNKSSPAEDSEHPYLIRKGIKAYPVVRQYKKLLVIPLFDINKNLKSLQFIAPDGTKRFLKNAQTKGLFFWIKGDDTLALCEGYATGASIFEATGYTTIIAFNAGNLQSVADQIRTKFPNRPLVICADNDAYKTKPDGTPMNTGREKAMTTAWALSLKVAIPAFQDVTSKPTDFNDLARLEGIEAVKAQIGEGRYPWEWLVEEAKDDVGAPYRPENLEGLRNLRQSNRPLFQRVRDDLKRLHVGVTALDEELDKSTSGSNGSKDSQADVLVRIAQQYELFHDGTDNCYARFKNEDHFETWPIRSEGFRKRLRLDFFGSEDKAPCSQALTDATGTIEAICQFEGPEASVYKRVAQVVGKIYIDLCSPQWEVIEVTQSGWATLKESPVFFTRSKGMLPMATPARNGDIGKLRPVLNLASDDDFILIVAWMLKCFIPDGPYPVLGLNGGQGSGKSSLTLKLKSIIDPCDVALRSIPKNVEDLAVGARHNHVLCFDNISSIQGVLSDALCCMSTGGAFATRELYTNGEESQFTFKQPICLNGIGDLIRRHDLADRTILISLPAIPEQDRLPEAEIQKRFDEALPSIFGGICDALSEALKNRETVKADRLPRMADFYLWILAAEPALPWETGAFERAYSSNREIIVDAAIENDLVASAIKHMFDNPRVSEWEGIASELLEKLSDLVGEKISKSKFWPINEIRLSTRLKRASAFLEWVGIRIEFKPSHGKRTIRISGNDRVPMGNDRVPITAISSAPENPNDNKKITLKTPSGNDGNDETPTSSVELRKNIGSEKGENRGVQENGYPFSPDRLGRNFNVTHRYPEAEKEVVQFFTDEELIIE